MKQIVGTKANWKISQRVLRHDVRRGRLNHVEAMVRQQEQIDLIKLSAAIHAETSPIIQAMIDADDKLNGRDHVNQGFVFSLGKYSADIKTCRPCKQLEDLACSNEIGGAAFLSGMDKADSDTRTFNEA